MRVRQGLRLDQQTASFVAVTAPAEANDNRVSGVFRLHTLIELRRLRFSGQSNKLSADRSKEA
jgi:hypothetical protein